MEDNQSQTILEEEDVLEDMEDHVVVEIQEMIEAAVEKNTATKAVKIATAVAADGNNCKT
jgi:hypothetical protein